MGKDPHHSARVEVAEQAVERETEFVRQFDEQVTALICQSKDLASLDFFDHVGFDSDIGPRLHP